MDFPSFSYSDEEDFRFPALKCRIESFEKFHLTGKSEKLELEGIFIFRSSFPEDKPIFHKGYLSLVEEYKLLDLKFPFSADFTIPCRLPVKETRNIDLKSKPNLRLLGRTWSEINPQTTGAIAEKQNKSFVAETVERLPVRYRGIGTPAFDSIWEIISYIYSGDVEYEHGPALMLSSLIGSERRTIQQENAGCGINIGTSPQSVPGGVSSGIAKPEAIYDFIKRVNVGPLDTLKDPLPWSRFLSLEDNGILHRKVNTNKEIDWNLLTGMEKLSEKVIAPQFTESDINLVFDPQIIPAPMSKKYAKDIKQTLLFAKSVPQLSYPKEIIATINVKAEKLRRDLYDQHELAPGLFSYRFEPLCDAFIKGNILVQYCLGNKINLKRTYADDFFKIARIGAFEFIDYLKDHVSLEKFSENFDDVNNPLAINLLKEIRYRKQMTRAVIDEFLIDKNSLTTKEDIDSIISQLEQAGLIIKRGEYYITA